jgi:hypothetical protein
MILWTNLFLEAHKYKMWKIILFFNTIKSAILLETSGKKRSGGKQMLALNICYIFITNQEEKGNT